MENSIFSWQFAYYVVFAVSLGMSLNYTAVKSWQMSVFRFLAFISSFVVILKPIACYESLLLNYMVSAGLVIVINFFLALLLVLIGVIFSLDIEKDILDKLAGKKK